MQVTDQIAALTAIEEGLDRLQRSARGTISMFTIGILATLLAAGVAGYYLFTLSADLRDARAALAQSQAALTEARANLAAVNTSLLQAQRSTSSPADASSIATAISDVSRSQASIRTASSSISEASAKLDTNQVSTMQTIRPIQRPPGKLNAPGLEGSFQVTETGDGFLSLRTGPNRASAEISKIPVGSSIECKAAVRNDIGSFWRPCSDNQGNSGFVSNTYLRKVSLTKN